MPASDIYGVVPGARVIPVEPAAEPLQPGSPPHPRRRAADQAFSYEESVLEALRSGADRIREDLAGGAHVTDISGEIERGAAATDGEQARQVWREFTQVLQEEQPFTFMFWLDELAATRDDLTGVTMDQRGELQSMAEWSLR